VPIWSNLTRKRDIGHFSSLFCCTGYSILLSAASVIDTGQLCVSDTVVGMNLPLQLT
jgi:hypothetical protein